MGLENHDFDHETRKSGLFPCYRLKRIDLLSSYNLNLKINIFTPLQQIPCYCKSRLGTLWLISWWRVTFAFKLGLFFCHYENLQSETSLKDVLLGSGEHMKVKTFVLVSFSSFVLITFDSGWVGWGRGGGGDVVEMGLQRQFVMRKLCIQLFSVPPQRQKYFVASNACLLSLPQDIYKKPCCLACLFVCFCFSQFEKHLRFLSIFHRCIHAKLVRGYVCAYQKSRVCVCYSIFFFLFFFFYFLICMLRLSEKHLWYMILWFNHNVMDVVNVFMFYLVTISDTTIDFLPGDNKDLLNWYCLHLFFTSWYFKGDNLNLKCDFFSSSGWYSGGHYHYGLCISCEVSFALLCLPGPFFIRYLTQTIFSFSADRQNNLFEFHCFIWDHKGIKKWKC